MLAEILSKFNLKHGGSYEEKFAESGLRIFEQALAETRARGQNYLSLGHLLNAFAIENPNGFNHLASRSEIDPTKAREFIRENLSSISKGAWNGVRIAPEVTSVFQRAYGKAQKTNRKIEAADLENVLAEGKLEFPRLVNWKAVRS